MKAAPVIMSKIKLYTSNFAKHKNNPGGVSIAKYTPRWVNKDIPRYTKLAPTHDMLMEIKYRNGTEENYRRRFKEEVLDKLDPHEVLKDFERMGVTVLLCFCATGAFCHRILVGNWLQEHTEVIVTELPK